jgi:hypothetical protein
MLRGRCSRQALLQVLLTLQQHCEETHVGSELLCQSSVSPQVHLMLRGRCSLQALLTLLRHCEETRAGSELVRQSSANRQLPQMLQQHHQRLLQQHHCGEGCEGTAALQETCQQHLLQKLLLLLHLLQRLRQLQAICRCVG